MIHPSINNVTLTHARARGELLGTINHAAGTSVILKVGGELGVDLADEEVWYVGCSSEIGVSEMVSWFIGLSYWLDLFYIDPESGVGVAENRDNID